MRPRLHGAGGLVVRERLESLDDGAHALSYTLLDSPELPWTDYLAHIRLTEADGRVLAASVHEGVGALG
jgi:hypothetical protein